MTEIPKIYKRGILLIRTLVTYLTLMPTFKFIRSLRKCRDCSAQILYNLTDLNTTLTQSSDDFYTFSFHPIQTGYGSFVVRVCCRRKCEFKLKIDLSKITQTFEKLIIPDYEPLPKKPEGRTQREEHGHTTHHRKSVHRQKSKSNLTSSPIVERRGSPRPYRKSEPVAIAERPALKRSSSGSLSPMSPIDMIIRDYYPLKNKDPESTSSSWLTTPPPSILFESLLETPKLASPSSLEDSLLDKKLCNFSGVYGCHTFPPGGQSMSGLNLSMPPSPGAESPTEERELGTLVRLCKEAPELQLFNEKQNWTDLVRLFFSIYFSILNSPF